MVLKERLDFLLVSRKLVPSREVAQSLIMRGDVLVGDVPVTKSGTRIPIDAEVRLRGELPRFVGRGGDKLESAIEKLGLHLEDRIALDLGASTGGFTDCLLQRGVSRVYAVDVGHNQLAHKLKWDTRVISLEGTHAKDLPGLGLNPPPNLAVIDVSFISLCKVLPFVFLVLARPGDILALVKPQFELSPNYVERRGVVKSEEHQLLAVAKVVSLLQNAGFESISSFPCSLKGGKSGNQEYFVYANGSKN